MTEITSQDSTPSFEELSKYLFEHYSSKYFSKERNKKDAEERAKLLLEMSSPIKERFVHWYKTGELMDDLEISGRKMGTLIKKGFIIPDAFIEFYGLYEEPNSYFSLRLFRQ
jgi:hypothetical protein